MNGPQGQAPIEGINVANVTRWLAERVEITTPLSFKLIAGGRSNMTFTVVDAAGRRFVLRRPPMGKLLPSAHDVAREHRIMAALAGTPVPVHAFDLYSLDSALVLYGGDMACDFDGSSAIQNIGPAYQTRFWTSTDGGASWAAQSPTDTTRTRSPYFSPNRAMAPMALASGWVIVCADTTRSSMSTSFTCCSTSCSTAGATAVGLGKSKRRRPGAFSEPICVAVSPSRSRTPRMVGCWPSACSASAAAAT